MVDPSVHGFLGAVFDGRYVYLVPGPGGPVGPAFDVVLRYDSQASFTTAGSWSTFATTTVDGNAKDFSGAGFDGRYVYLVPSLAPGGAPSGQPRGFFTRYDTTSDFTSAGSWSGFDLATLDATAAGFSGATFDGRFVYVAPNPQLGRRLIARYDTTGGLTSTTSWSTFDPTTLHPNTGELAGAAFDGQRVYFVPSSSGVVTRFDAKSPASMPALCANSAALHCYYGSFF
jgi:hypothetical protein